MRNPVITIIGRPNVGKSTLFNRLTKSRHAIVHDAPGVTRDRIYGTFLLEGFGECTLVDTGGFEAEGLTYQPFDKNYLWDQTEAAIEGADLVLLTLDAKFGLHAHDEELLRYLERLSKPYVLLANKIDSVEHSALAHEFCSMGIDVPLAISAAHNKGIHELRDLLMQRIQELGLRAVTKTSDAESTNIAIIGRPNAGKSSLLNRLAGEQRSIVSPVSGTTRDHIDFTFTYNKTSYTIVDTAGIRRRTKINEFVESESVIRALRAMDAASVVVHIIDATAGITDQDLRLINLALRRHKPLLLVVNKWDLIENKDSNSAKAYQQNIRDCYLRDAPFVPIRFVSCLTNTRVARIMQDVEELMRQSTMRVTTSKVNAFLSQLVERHPPHLVRRFSKRIKFYFGTQNLTSPPTFIVSTNLVEDVSVAYRKYILRSLRSEFGFSNVPIRLIIKSKHQNSALKKAQ